MALIQIDSIGDFRETCQTVCACPSRTTIDKLKTQASTENRGNERSNSLVNSSDEEAQIKLRRARRLDLDLLKETKLFYLVPVPRGGGEVLTEVQVILAP